MTAVDTALPVAKAVSVVELVREPASPPTFLINYFERRDQLIRNELRLCNEVLAIPVSESEVREIEEELQEYVKQRVGQMSNGGSTAPSRKDLLIYGIVSGNLVILPEDIARAAAEDLEGIWALRTFGEARRFEPQFFSVPGLNEENYDEIPADEDPYDVRVTSEFQNGDWPASAATIALDYLPADLDDIGEEVEHFPLVPTVDIDPAIEADLIETLQRRGYEVLRDDDLIVRIGR